MLRARAFLVLSLFIRTLQARLRTMHWHMLQASAQAEQVSLKQHSKKKQKQTFSANRLYYAAVLQSL